MKATILLVLLGVLIIPLDCKARIVESLTDPPLGSIRNDDDKCKKRVGVSSPVRAGTSSVRFELNSCGQRAEIGIPGNPPLDQSTWYSWSTMLDPNWKKSYTSFDIIMQWHGDTNSLPCGGGGYHMTAIDDRLVLTQTYRSQGKIKCQRINLLNDYAPMIGKWTDFVMNINYTEKENGYVRFWIQIDGGGYKQVFDYKGPTWFEKEAPYTQYGIYKGDPNQKSPYPRILWTDEVKRGDASSTFEEMAAKGSLPPSNSRSFQLALASGWNLISLPVDPKETNPSTLFSSIAGKYQAIYSFDSQTGQYKGYIPGEASNDLSSITSGAGYWIYMDSSANLTVEGAPAAQPIALKAGWNLVGVNSMSPVQSATIFTRIANKISAVYSYSGDSYKSYIPGTGGDLTTIQPGMGLWIYADEAVNWSN
jgi:hypothetical protein